MRSQANGTNEDIAIVRKFMLAFGGLALFVGGFVIFNTLSTTVAQRTRELATLRTLGASRRQVLGSVLLESLVIGAVASALGLVLGPALAKGAERALRRARAGSAADRRVSSRPAPSSSPCSSAS